MPPALFILAICVVGPAYLLAKRVGLVMPLAFIASCVLAVGAHTFLSVVVFGMIDVKFRHVGLVRAWLEVSWPIGTIVIVPHVISALIACWFSCPPTRRDAAALLGVYLFLILVWLAVIRAVSSAVNFWFLLALPSTIFFAIALAKRVAQDHGGAQGSSGRQNG